MLIDGSKVIEELKKNNIVINGVLHIGAHECEELGFYGQLVVDKSNIIWIDGNINKVNEAKNKGIPNVYYSLITDKDDEYVNFNITNNGQSSSVLDFGTHLNHHPWVQFIEKQNHKTITVDTFYEKNNLDMSKYDFWNFDIQGAELMALNGATQSIKYAKALYLEVNTEDVYKGCGKLDEIDTFVSKYGFKRVITQMTHAGWGDALYLKINNKNINKLVLYARNHNFPHPKNYESIQRMCKSYFINFEYTSNKERLKQNDYQLLLLTNEYISPDELPSNINIIYGPHHWVLPEGSLVGNIDNTLKDRCVYNSLSQWVKELYYEIVPSLKIPLYSFPFSVNIEKFQPSNLAKDNDCILYIKQRSNDLSNFIISLLDKKKIKYNIIKYGSYNENNYINLLHTSKFMLVLDIHESQGFALEEAMSCNIPLLILDATTMYDEMPDGINSTYNHLKPKKLLSTSVPYWSDECGIKILEKEDLSNAIDTMINNYQSFNPRNYILNNLSDKICMKRILDYFNYS
jgi:hypothetical protein